MRVKLVLILSTATVYLYERIMVMFSSDTTVATVFNYIVGRLALRL